MCRNENSVRARAVRSEGAASTHWQIDNTLKSTGTSAQDVGKREERM